MFSTRQSFDHCCLRRSNFGADILVFGGQKFYIKANSIRSPQAPPDGKDPLLESVETRSLSKLKSFSPEFLLIKTIQF